MNETEQNVRDRSIEDPSNRFLIHPLSRALLGPALRLGASANAVSLAGLAFGFAAALAYSEWRDWRFATLGLVLMLIWHVLDGLDGMVARARGTSSPVGRLLDGLCDISTFVLVYGVIGATLPAETPAAVYALMVVAGAAHVIQSALYEGERDRFHAFSRGERLEPWQPSLAGGAGEKLYLRFRRLLSDRPATIADVAGYRRRAVPVLRAMIPLNANARTVAVWLACLADKPEFFWVWEVLVLSPLCWWGITALRRSEGMVPVMASH